MNHNKSCQYCNTERMSNENYCLHCGEEFVAPYNSEKEFSEEELDFEEYL